MLIRISPKNQELPYKSTYLAKGLGAAVVFAPSNKLGFGCESFGWLKVHAGLPKGLTAAVDVVPPKRPPLVGAAEPNMEDLAAGAGVEAGVVDGFTSSGLLLVTARVSASISASFDAGSVSFPASCRTLPKLLPKSDLAAGVVVSSFADDGSGLKLEEMENPPP